RFTFLGIVKPAAKRLHPHHWEIILRRQEGEAAPHLVVASDAGDGEFQRGNIGENGSAAPTQLAIFVGGELAIIMTRALPGGEHIYHFLRADWHDRLQHHSIDQRENGRVNSDGQRQRQYGDCRESRRLEKLPQSKPEILYHNDL